MRERKTPLVWVGISLLLALAGGVACLLALGLGLWVSRASLGMIPAPVTPTVLPGPPTVQPGNATPAQAGVQPGSSARQLPELPRDIPLPKSADPQSFVGGPDQYSFLTGETYREALDFYMTGLPEAGWEKVDYGTRLGQSSAELHFRKDNRLLTVRIVDLQFIGRLVEVSLQA